MIDLAKDNKVSFCTTCMNRLEQYKQTAVKNIRDNLSYPFVEHVLLDYNSKDGLEEWVKSNLRQWVDCGRLKYYKTTEPKYFDMSHAKNCAHKLATGDILVNLDCDNFTGVGYASFLNTLFQQNSNVAVNLANNEGAVAVSRDNFVKLGGYDESFLPMTFQDQDFLARAFFANVEVLKLTGYYNNIERAKHSWEHKLDNINPSCLPNGINFLEQFNKLHETNKHKMLQNLLNKRCTVNQSKEWGKYKLSKILCSEEKPTVVANKKFKTDLAVKVTKVSPKRPFEFFGCKLLWQLEN